MGKRKTKQTPNEIEGDKESKKDKDTKIKGKKTYSLQQKGAGVQPVEEESNLTKVKIPEKLEEDLIVLINEDQKSRQYKKDVSKRLTSKKLTDIYNNLIDVGFSRGDVESAMSNCIINGGDLIDALDWLCLNIPNDQLPQGFSNSLQIEEEKVRPKFDHSLLESETVQLLNQTIENSKYPQATEHLKSETASKGGNGEDMKNWILQYADQSSGSEEESGDDKVQEFDPNNQYTELHDQLQDLKNKAAIAKSTNMSEKHKELSKKLREMHLEMASLEKHPDFDKSIKEKLKANLAERQIQPRKALDVAAEKVVSNKSNDNLEDDEDAADNFGFGLFDNVEKESSKPSSPVKHTVEDIRTFEYTRAQWTGKSPKQFLIDWVRKNLKKCSPPKFKSHQIRVACFKSTCTLDKTNDGELKVTPEILCQNKMEAEHLASVLALYKLCKGQAIHQLLPPTYRTVWLEWQDLEKKEKDKVKEKKDKPRDQFISRLMKKLKITPDSSDPLDSSPSGRAQDLDEEDDWEALADSDNLPELNVRKASSVTSELGSNCTSKSQTLVKALESRQKSEEYQTILKTRQTLPVFQFRDQIISAVRSNNIVVVAGETGSGKSTQVPQFLLEDCITNHCDDVHIVCTQPRRISATSLALRVSQEIGEKGYNVRDCLVGYQIRFESRRGPNTRLLYCTTGVVLRQLQADSELKNISHLIIDEVHERSVQSDFLIVVLKSILKKRPDLKIILMSATLDSEKFSSYFNHCPVINIPGRTFPVENYYIEDIIEFTGYVIDDDSPYCLRKRDLVQEQSTSVSITQKGGEATKQTLSWTKEEISRIDRTDLSSEKYSLRTRNAVTRLNLNRVNYDLIVDLLLYLNSSPPFCDIDGAVIIFLPGLRDIQEMNEILSTQRQFSDPNKYKIFPLHSVLSSENQQAVFEKSRTGVRKIVLATNIAETGITIPDAVYVIDTGKAKENRYMESSQMSALEEVFISKANCKQRAGRAGRVREGFCFRLYTEAQFKEFRPYIIPELLRVPLEELCLSIMKCEYGNPHEFLALAIDPPPSGLVNRAMSVLVEVGACHSDFSKLTPLGHHLAILPVDVRIGKMLIMAAVFGCLDQIAVIAAAMTDKSPFVVPFGKKSDADLAKEALEVAQSDHLTLYNAYSGWIKARASGKSTEATYLKKYCLKKATLIDIENVKNDLIKLMKTIGFDSCDTPALTKSKTKETAEGVLKIREETSSDSKELHQSSISMIKAVMTAGLYPQVGCIVTEASIDPSEKSSCLVDTATGVAQIHPSSVNKCLSDKGVWMVYQEKVRLSRVFLRDTTAVSPYALLLFGGFIDVQHNQRLITLDSWIKFKAVVRTGVIFKELRKSLNNLLSQKLKDPSLNVSGSKLINLLRKLIQSEHAQR